MRTDHLRSWALASVFWVLAGCHKVDPAKPEPSPLCALAVPARLAHEKPDALPPAVWFALLFKGYREGIGADPVDCSGEPIAWAELPMHCSQQEPVRDAKPHVAEPRISEPHVAEPHVAEPRVSEPRVSEPHLAEPRSSEPSHEPLLVRHAGADFWFAWAPFRHFDNGMREGPIAIARLYDGKLEARAVGTLRAFAGKARLEVRRLGREHLLVAEGEWCASPTVCVRGTRLMWLDRQRFRARPLRSAGLRNCLGPAWFVHAEVLEKKLAAHWSRTLTRATALTYEQDYIALQERVIVHDRDLERPALPPRLYRDAQAQLRLTVRGGELLSEGQSLWTAIRVADSATKPTGGATEPTGGATEPTNSTTEPTDSLW